MASFHASGYSAVLRAFEDNELNHLGFVLHKLALLGLVFAIIKLQLGLVGIVGAHLIANLLLWYFYHLLVTHLYAPVPLRIDVPLWKALLFSALPMGGGVMLRSLALQLDILVLAWMTNLTAVGLFSGPYRLSMAMRLIPQTLSLPLYPLYSRTAHFSPQRFTEAYQWSVKFFALISFPMAAFFAAWSKPILQLALGTRYLAAIPAMQLLGIGLVPFFLSVLFQYLFAAVAMALVLVLGRSMPIPWQIGTAILALTVYVAVLFALRTFSIEEIRHAREGLGFLSPFVESWTKKLKRNTRT